MTIFIPDAGLPQREKQTAEIAEFFSHDFKTKAYRRSTKKVSICVLQVPRKFLSSLFSVIVSFAMRSTWLQMCLFDSQSVLLFGVMLHRRSYA